MKHTPESLSTKTLPALDEIMVLAMYHAGCRSDEITNVITGNPYSKTSYSPTTNKAQAWDLMVKYLAEVSIEELCSVTGRKSPLEAVTLAAIVIIQGE